VSDLLKKVVLKTGGRTPLMMEFPVNPELAPFLVTAAGKSKFIWIPSSKGRVRVGVRKQDSGERVAMNLDIIREIALVGETSKWGNVHPLTSDGFEKAVEHLKYYGVEDIEVLASDSGLPFIVDSPVKVCAWLHKGCAVVVPKDRDCVGVFADVGKGFLAMVHNPSRGVAVLGEP